jgi:hypothetical protein
MNQCILYNENINPRTWHNYFPNKYGTYVFMFMILFFVIKLVYTPKNLHVIEVYISIFLELHGTTGTSILTALIVTKQNTSTSHYIMISELKHVHISLFRN